MQPGYHEIDKNWLKIQSPPWVTDGGPLLIMQNKNPRHAGAYKKRMVLPLKFPVGAEGSSSLATAVKERRLWRRL